MPNLLTSSVVTIPDGLMSKWQSVVDILARASGFTAALIMRVKPPEVEVFVTSKTDHNPYVAGEKANLNTGLYCETVMSTLLPLYVPDALADPLWEKNPDVSLGMICYFGMPIRWPDGKPFGTICILDRERRSVSSYANQLIELFRDLIEGNLEQLVTSAKEELALIAAHSDAEDRHAAIFQQAAAGIARVGPDGTWLEANNSLCAFLGYSREELLQRTFQDITYPEDLDNDLNHVQLMLNGSIDRYSIEKRYLHKQGHVVWALLTVALVRQRDGAPRYFISIIEDINDKKALQRAVEQTQKLEAIGRLVGGVAHEFNNQLAAISGNLFLAGKNKQQSERYVRNAEALCMKASELVKSLLVYARKGTAQKSTIHLNDFLAETMLHFRAILPESNSLRVVNSADRMRINANATQLQQIILNLLNNARDAVHAVDHPEIVVDLDLYNADTAFRLRHANIPSDRMARLTVSDNGIGIPEKLIDKIFDPFFTTKPVERGTGLGLAMVASLVAQHNGAVEVKSVPGKGAQFSIFLPLIENDQDIDVARASVADVDQTPANLRILVVDDNSNVLSVTREVLESLGYKTFAAQNGYEALELYKELGNIDCVLTDVVMPVMGGVELWHQLKKIDRNAKVVLVTGYDMLEQVSALSETCPILFKPFDVADLNRALRDQ